jgi:hypothetical protein
MARRRNIFRGDWRIAATDLWARADLDEFAPAYITFGANRHGELKFIAIEADIDYRVGKRDENPAVEFSWQGSDDGQPISGRGWAQFDDGQITGRLFIHQGDETTFIAKRKPSNPTLEPSRLARRSP